MITKSNNSSTQKYGAQTTAAKQRVASLTSRRDRRDEGRKGEGPQQRPVGERATVEQAGGGAAGDVATLVEAERIASGEPRRRDDQ